MQWCARYAKMSMKRTCLQGSFEAFRCQSRPTSVTVHTAARSQLNIAVAATCCKGGAFATGIRTRAIPQPKSEHRVPNPVAHPIPLRVNILVRDKCKKQIDHAVVCHFSDSKMFTKSFSCVMCRQKIQSPRFIPVVLKKGPHQRGGCISLVHPHRTRILCTRTGCRRFGKRSVAFLLQGQCRSLPVARDPPAHRVRTGFL